ncbi:MAG: hypothetical protein methR_P0737 [Methyloprofundus sp.]|nr:MAG: hypothetical protein methR_P0737 [Methyloprofundus sp.]
MLYISAATDDWYYSEENDSFYALSKEHIETAEKYAKKVKYFAPSKQITIDRLQKLNETIKQSKTRKFTGGWGTLIIILFFSIIMFSTGGFLMGITCILYYFALRTPQYVSANFYFADKDDRSFGDRIASFFVTDGMVFFGPGVMGGFVGLMKANFIMSIIRLVVRVSLLPITVALGFFNNYSKKYAFIYIGSMVAFIIIMNIVNIPTENPAKNIIKKQTLVVETKKL